MPAEISTTVMKFSSELLFRGRNFQVVEYKEKEVIFFFLSRALGPFKEVIIRLDLQLFYEKRLADREEGEEKS